MNKILITGSKGMVGRSFSNALRNLGYLVEEHSRSKVDLEDSVKTKSYFEEISPDLVIHCAALVGGIKANIDGGFKFYEINRSIDSNVFSASLAIGLHNLIYMSSSCIYPSNQSNSMREELIGREPIEPTNRPYALAKIEGTQIVSSISNEKGINWRTVVASNLYGPYDNFSTNSGHLLASVINKVMWAKSKNASTVEMWGDGSPRREFTFVDELTQWLSNSIEKIERFPVVMNVGYGRDYSVREYYEMVINLIDPSIKIVPNLDVPNGAKRKLMDSTKAKILGWNPVVSPESGIIRTINWLNKETEIKN